VTRGSITSPSTWDSGQHAHIASKSESARLTEASHEVAQSEDALQVAPRQKAAKQPQEPHGDVKTMEARERHLREAPRR